jgi:hypothetical protein
MTRPRRAEIGASGAASAASTTRVALLQLDAEAAGLPGRGAVVGGQR